MLALVFCLHQNVRAEEIAQPTEKDVYIHHDDGEDYVANRYERAIVVDLSLIHILLQALS